MIDTAIHWTKTIVLFCLGAWLVWTGITHADQVAHFIVTIVRAVEVFFTTLANGVFN